MMTAYQRWIQKTTNTTETKSSSTLANKGAFFNERKSYTPHDALDFFGNQYFADNQGATSNAAQRMLLIREQRNTVATKIISKRRSFQRSLLLHHITRGETEQAQKIIADNPEILFEPGTHDTPVQLARYLHDVDMLKMMKTYLSQVKDGEKQFALTLKEADEEEGHHEAYDFKRLISSLNFYDNYELKKEMTLFLAYFNSDETKKLKSYNIKDLLQAYASYVSAAKPSDDQLDDEQLCFVLCKVLGHLQNTLPLHYLKAISPEAIHKNKPNDSVILSTHKIWIKEKELRKPPSLQTIKKDWQRLELYYQTTMKELHILSQASELQQGSCHLFKAK